MEKISQGFMSAAVSDEETLATIAHIFKTQGGYLLDPHGAVAVAAVDQLYGRPDPVRRAAAHREDG